MLYLAWRARILSGRSTISIYISKYINQRIAGELHAFLEARRGQITSLLETTCRAVQGYLTMLWSDFHLHLHFTVKSWMVKITDFFFTQNLQHHFGYSTVHNMIYNVFYKLYKIIYIVVWTRFYNKQKFNFLMLKTLTNSKINIKMMGIFSYYFSSLVRSR